MRVLRLPSTGRLLVGTDLQGNLGDFRQLMTHFEAAGDAWLVLTGDLVHGPNQDTVDNWPDFLGTPYRDESAALVDAFQAAQRRFPGRVHCLLGNHDHSHIGGPPTSKFHDDERAVLESQLDADGVQRLHALINAFPLVAIAPNGAVMLHAAPSSALDSVEELESVSLQGYEGWHFGDLMQVPVLGHLLWSRAATPEQSRRFLKALGGTVALFGHDVVREGYARDAADQLCFSTSFGLFDEAKVFVSLDLAAHYADANALREGHEILKLWPAAGR